MNDACRNSDCTASNNAEGNFIGQILRHQPGIGLQGLRKSMESPSQDNLCSGRDPNHAPLLLKPTCSEIKSNRMRWAGHGV
jgi:hypothetical protein